MESLCMFSCVILFFFFFCSAWSFKGKKMRERETNGTIYLVLEELGQLISRDILPADPTLFNGHHPNGPP